MSASKHKPGCYYYQEVKEKVMMSVTFIFSFICLCVS